jgi:hypothetical protein
MTVDFVDPLISIANAGIILVLAKTNILESHNGKKYVCLLFHYVAS